MSSIRKLFSAQEWEWFLKLGASYSDAEQKKVFFEAIKEKKLENPNYNLFTDFPKEGSGEKPAPSPTANSPSADGAPLEHTPRHKFKGAEICQQIIKQLKPGGAA